MATKLITSVLLLVLVCQQTISDAEGPLGLQITENYFHGYTGHIARSDQLQRKKELQPREVSHPLEWVTTSPNISDACRTGWQYLWIHNQSLLKAKPSLGKTSLAERALDAFGKPRSGAFLGALSSLGSYDECLSTEHVQYCIVPMVATRLPLPVIFTGMLLGICIPRECTEKDATTTAQVFLNPLYVKGYLAGGPYISIDVTRLDLTDSLCQTERHPPFNAGAIVTIVLCSAFLAAGVVGTCIHWALDRFKATDGNENEEKNKTLALLLDVLTSFSLRKNISALISTKDSPSSIRCLNGIRVLSTMWIILFHSPSWFPVTNKVYHHYDVRERVSYRTVRQQFTTAIGVSSFFLLSGLLVTYQRLRDMDKKNGKFPTIRYYVHRYLRITPTYMFVLMLYWFLTMHLSEGPLHQFYMGENSLEYRLCERQWWRNLLYINNFKIPACMGHSWYLSLDLQFYYVSPLLIVLLYYSLPLGLTATGIFFAGSVAANGAIADYYADGNRITEDLNYGKEIYRTPYCHITPWLAGVVLGYIFFRRVTIPTRIRNFNIHPWILHSVLWFIAGALLLSVVYVIPTFDSMMITALFREPMWGIGLALVVYACHVGYGGLVNSFLSMRIWLPLSRLTFSAYLIHPVVLFILKGDVRDPIPYTEVRFAAHYTAVTVLSYAAAAVIAVFVEFPIGNLDQLLFNTLEKKMPGCWPRTVSENATAKALSLLQASSTTTPADTATHNFTY